MRAIATLPIGSLAVGAALVVYAIARGGATLHILLIVPVVSGSSAAFLGGVGLLFLGFVLLPLVFLGPPASPDGGPPGSLEDSPVPTGGVLLVGPVPIFLGSWSRVSRRTRWVVAALAAGALVLLIVLVALGL